MLYLVRSVRMGPQDTQNIRVIWRGKDLHVEVLRTSKVHELGNKLQKLTNVKSDTLRLLVPKSGNKSSWLVSPFSDEHSSLSLQEASILEGKPIRMMGAFDNEVTEVSQTSMKSDLRILGFDVEEKRLRQRSSNSPHASLKLPQGTYIFCDFRTLHLPGIELNPPPSEALRRMHMLACDPGIIAIMNKHRWRVGIMTEMAPVGYVGISPKCILGFNKNHGEEISLRLRTDDLKGFRKYESIKTTLLHELAHMVYSEHDANFFALNKQLNQEASSLDWTKSRSHTLSGRSISDHYEEMLLREVTSTNSGKKLGGASISLASARASSVAAAYSRTLNAPSEEPYPLSGQLSDATVEPDPDDDELKGVPEKIIAEPDPDDTLMIENYVMPPFESSVYREEPDPDDSSHKDNPMMLEPDPDDLETPIKCDPNNLHVVEAVKITEPDPDDSLLAQRNTAKKLMEPDPDDNFEVVSCSSDSAENGIVIAESDLDDNMDGLQRIEEPAAAVCSRIQRAIEMLRSEATPVEASSALQTLVKIIRNVIEHPREMKFRKLRKSIPQIQRNVVSYKAAMEVLTMIGFSEDVISDEVGSVETYLVLKRNDPGLLWLAKSSLEVSMA